MARKTTYYIRYPKTDLQIFYESASNLVQLPATICSLQPAACKLQPARAA